MNYFLFLLFSFGLLTSMPIILFGSIIPNGILALTLLLILLYTKIYSTVFLVKLVILSSFLMLHSFFAPVNFIESLNSIAQLFVSILIGFYFFQLLKSFKTPHLYRICLSVVIITLIGCFFEILGLPIKSFSDWFRSKFLFSSATENLRDVVHYGFARPYFFTTEPSHVAKFLFILFYY